MRCPSCGGLRGVEKKNAAKAGRCRECRSRKVMPVSKFYGYWTSRFTMDEIREMANAIWG